MKEKNVNILLLLCNILLLLMINSCSKGPERQAKTPRRAVEPASICSNLWSNFVRTRPLGTKLVYAIKDHRTKYNETQIVETSSDEKVSLNVSRKFSTKNPGKIAESEKIDFAKAEYLNKCMDWGMYSSFEYPQVGTQVIRDFSQSDYQKTEKKKEIEVQGKKFSGKSVEYFNFIKGFSVQPRSAAGRKFRYDFIKLNGSDLVAKAVFIEGGNGDTVDDLIWETRVEKTLLSLSR